LGALFYANRISDNEYLDIKSKRTFDQVTLNRIVNERQRAIKLNETKTPSKKINSEVGINSIINYEYSIINGVPDYQQNDNTSMNNDCVPTAAASVLMYWDGNGYPNLSTSNNWKNVADRLGELMDHNNTYGVYSSDIKPGLDDYISEKNYSSSFSVARDTTPSFNEFKSEVNADSPGLLRLTGHSYTPEGSDGGHLVTLVGYETYTDTSNWSNPQYALVQDNWATTGQTVYILLGQFGAITDLWKIRD
jgi:hypothetical protein